MASLSDKLAKLRSKQKPGGAKAAETEPKAPAAAPAEAPAKPAPRPAAKPAPAKKAPKKSRLADLRAGGAKAKPPAKGRPATEAPPEEGKPKEEQPEPEESEFRVHTPPAAVIQVTYSAPRQAISMPLEQYDRLKQDIQEQLYEILDPSAMGQLEDEQVKATIQGQAETLLGDRSVRLSRAEQEQFYKDLVDEMTGYGPLQPLLEDADISDILVNGCERVFIEKGGVLHLTDIRFRDNDHLRSVIDRIVGFVGRHVDESSPMCDARLPDGSRVNTIIPPLSLDYPSLCIRKFRADAVGANEIVNEFHSLTEDMILILQSCVKARLNMLISGGGGSGKTTLLNVMSGFIPLDERICTIEDSAELALQQPHVVRMETRPANIEGEGEVGEYDLLRNALRMRPDRIILGEVRGKEALDMLQAMNTGHEGSMSTIHANTPRDALSRMETMIAMGGVDLPQSAMRQQIASAIDLIIQINRYPDGSRKVSCISEVLGMEGDTVTMQDIFLFERMGMDEEGNVQGRHLPTGVTPRFMLRLKAAGIDLPGAIFLPDATPEEKDTGLIFKKLSAAQADANEPQYRVKHSSNAAAAEEYNKLKNGIQRRLYDRMDSAVLGSLKEGELANHIGHEAAKLLDEANITMNRREREQFIHDITDEMTGFGPLEPLLRDPEVSDILTNGCNQTYVEVSGKLKLTDVKFNDNSHLMHVIDKIVTLVGRHIDEGSPMCDARLPDGSRVNAIIPPLAVDYPSLSIRKFKRDALSVEDLVYNFGSMSEQMAVAFEACVKGKLNMLISGGTGSGKTTLLNILSAFIPPDERVITIEDSAELQLQQPHVVRMETRPPNIEGKGAVNAYDLLRNSMRMRADRIIVGEVRGREALDMLQAMNTGHEGSMSTVHANTPRDALSRIETMISMAGIELPQRAMRQQISSAIDVIVQGNRLSDGSRKLTFLSEVLGMEGDAIVMQDLFAFEREGISEEGKVKGRFIATGVQPRFMQKMKAAGIEISQSVFMPPK